MTARQLAQAEHERKEVVIYRTKLDWCGQAQFGTGTCAATGEPCYHTYASCKDKAHYIKSSKLRSYGERGMQPILGELIRPYVLSENLSPTEIPIGGGLATRSNNSFVLTDEVCSDIEDDPYYATRSTPAQGTYQSRLMARNYNYVGREVERLHGYIVEPFNWNTFQSELYVIQKIAQDKSGNYTYTLNDIVQVMEQNLLPKATTGKLVTELKDYAIVAYVASADATHLTLPPEASPIEGAYVGFEYFVSQNTSAGERRVCTAYVGATRTATLNTAWDVIPDTTSVVEVSALSINVGSGAQYNDPAVTGEPEYICIGKEEIRYTAIVGDVLSFPDSTYRAQWGTPRENHNIDAGVNQVLVVVDKSANEVIEMLLNACGILDVNIDLAGLASEVAMWMPSERFTASVAAKPEKATGLLNEFLKDIGMVSWWDAVARLQRFKYDMPALPYTNKAITTAEQIDASTSVSNLDDQRITESILSYAPYSATGQMNDRVNFKITEAYIEGNAESANEYNGVIQKQRYSRWLTEGNSTYAMAWVRRHVNKLRDAPIAFEFTVDPKDEISIGQLVDVTMRGKTDMTGLPVAIEARVMKLQPTNQGNFQAKAINTAFASRPIFFAPSGTGDYPASKEYWHFSDATGLMADGTKGYELV